MRLVKFEHEGRVHQGVSDGSTIWGLDLGVSLPDHLAPFDVESLTVLAGNTARAAFHVEAGSVALCAPVSPTAKIICLGFNYRAHAEETLTDVAAQPPLFSRWPDTLVGHARPLMRPTASTAYDFEGELAVVIGRSGRNLSPEQAEDHILGYAAFMDGSIRDFQKHSPTAGKNFPRAGAMGPWVTPASALGGLESRTLETRVNGETVQSTRLGLMIFDVCEIIAYVSRFTPLSPGDVIATGTPGGVGAKRTPPLWLRAGDTVEVEIAGLPVLSNLIMDEEEPAA